MNEKGCVNHWRGVWGTLDVYTGIGWTTALMSIVIGITGLIWLRAFRNIMAPPLVIIVDDPEGYFTFPTMFRTIVIFCCLFIEIYYSVIIIIRSTGIDI